MDNTSSCFTCCCENPECSKAQKFNETFQKVECDARLAAEIGQALLSEKDEDLHYETFKDSYQELKQLRWEKEKSDEMIYSLKSKVEAITTQNTELKKELGQEIQKKRLCDKLLQLKADIEDELKTQNSDLKQELCQLRKSENNIISKYKRLNLNHETLQLTHDALVQEHDVLLSSISYKEQPLKIKHNNDIEPNYKQQQQQQPQQITTNQPSENTIPESIPNNVHRTKSVPQFQIALTNSNKNPFDVLHSVTRQTFDKINATDTRVLNRRLKRVFDMSELSDMSNSILSTVLVDLSEFHAQFDWAHDYPNTEYFFPLVVAIGELLQEVSTMKMTLNDLQADYVRRIERLTQPAAITTTTTTCSVLYLQQQQYMSPYSTSSRFSERRRESLYNIDNSNPLGGKKSSFMQGLLSLFTLH